MLSQEIKDRVMELKNIGMTNRGIKGNIDMEFGCNIALGTISNWTKTPTTKTVPKFGDDEKVDQISNNLIDTNQYRIEGENYAFDIKVDEGTYDTIEIPMTIVDDIFRDFSARPGGKNLTSYQCIQRYNLDQYHINGTKVFNLLTNRLSLNKYCNILSPQTCFEIESTHGIEELKRVLTQRVRETVRNKYTPEIDALMGKEVQQYNEKCAKTLGSYKSLINWFNSKIKVENLVPIEFKNKNFLPVGKPLTILMGDAHLGRKSDQNTIDRLQRLGDDIINRHPKELRIIGMGDWFETLVTTDGGMHQEQFMEMNKYSTELVEHTFNVFAGFFKRLIEHNIEVTLDMMGGNHDRISKNNNEDNARLGSYFLYMLLRETMKHPKFKINYLTERINTLVDGKLVYIVGHGDTDLYKRNPEELIAMYGIPGHYHIIAMGHLHSYKKSDGMTRKVESGRQDDTEGTNFTRIIVPALCDGNWYSEQVVVKRSAPGAVYVTKNDGLSAPDILNKRL